MVLDIKKVPFSRYGSYFVFSEDADSGELHLRDVHGGDEAPSRIFKILPVKDGQPVAYSLDASETRLSIRAADDPEYRVNICISGEDTIHLEGHGMGLRFYAVKTKYDNVLQFSKDQWEFHFYSHEIKMMFSVQNGGVSLEAPWNIVGNDGICMDVEPSGGYMHMVIESYTAVWRPKAYIPYSEAQECVDLCYGNWYASMPRVPDRYGTSKELASYITWSCVVHPQGRLTRYAMYMSKNWMYNIWSWDNCFNAMMLAKSHPELALDQLELFAGHQDRSGVYPDFINDRYCSFNCCKPPIHAWAFQKLRSVNPFFNSRDIIQRMYESFSRATDYWLVYRRRGSGSLPVYNHGNDSGWDNASVFHKGIPVESPDLAAHLIRQMDILAEMAGELGKRDEKEKWGKEAEDMYGLLLRRLWKNGRFIALYAPDESEIACGESLLLQMPVLLGSRLPDEIRQALLKRLRSDFECTYGLATESPKSALYKKNGYWLGPVWAPVMYMIIDALKNMGEAALAQDYARRFCEATLTGGMAENFDPVTGQGLVDPAFTWTSSVFLMLADEYPDTEGQF